MDEQEQNAQATAAKVGALAGLYATGSLTLQQFVEAFAMLVYVGKVQAARLAEVTLWRWSIANWPAPIPPLGIVPPPAVLEPLRKAAQTLAETSGGAMPEAMPEGVPEPDDSRRTVEEIARGAVSFKVGVEIVGRAERVGSDAAKESGRETAQQRMRREGIEAWKWVARPDACDECKRRDGNVYPMKVTFRDHPECNCYLEPATAKEQAISARKRAAAIRKKEAHAREVEDPAGAEHGAGAAA